MKDRNKPTAAFVEQGKDAKPEDLRTLQEEQRRAEDIAKIEAIKNAGRSKLSKMLTEETYVNDWTHPCLYVKEMHVQTSVSEYYPNLNLALDKFFHYDEHELRLTAFKKQALNAIGIKYVVVTPEKDLADVEAEIAAQKVPAVAK